MKNKINYLNWRFFLIFAFLFISLIGIIFKIFSIQVSDSGFLKDEGAKRIFACASHAVFSPPSHERLSIKDLFEQVIVTNSIPVEMKDSFPQLKVLSVANMLGEALWRIHEESSVSSMFR